MASLATLKKDALMYIGGMMLGLFFFGEIEKDIHSFMKSGFLGDSVTLPEYFGIPAWIVAVAISIIAISGFYGAEWLERRNHR